MLQKLKEIAVIFDASAAGQRVLKIAAQLAGAHGARLVGVSNIKGNSEGMQPGAFARGKAMLEVIQRREAFIDEQSRSAAESMARVSVHHGVTALFRGAYEIESIKEMVLQFFHSDLLVVSHPDAPGAPFFWSTDRALHHTGGPILIVPDAWQGKDVGRTIVVAWNSSRPARRAVLDALPLLSAAQKVYILIVDPDDQTPPDPESDVAAYLERHDVKVELLKVGSHGRPIADVIVDHAQARGADLIVFGAYSHHRVSEIVLGGVTRSLLASVPLPLFASH